MTSDSTRWLLLECNRLRRRLRDEQRRSADLFAWMAAQEWMVSP